MNYQPSNPNRKPTKGFEDVEKTFSFFINKKKADDLTHWIKTKFQGNKNKPNLEDIKNEPLDKNVAKMLNLNLNPNTTTPAPTTEVETPKERGDQRED